MQHATLATNMSRQRCTARLCRHIAGTDCHTPDKVIAAMAETLYYVGLIILSTDHNDRHHCIWNRLAQLHTELMTCIGERSACSFDLNVRQDTEIAGRG